MGIPQSLQDSIAVPSESITSAVLSIIEVSALVNIAVDSALISPAPFEPSEALRVTLPSRSESSLVMKLEATSWKLGNLTMYELLVEMFKLERLTSMLVSTNELT